MSFLPTALLESLSQLPGFNLENFEHVHNSGEQVTSVRINPAKIQYDSDNQELLSTVPDATAHLSFSSRVPWASSGFYLTERPSFTFDPLFHAGTYYVQEASSMFLEQALRQTVDLALPLRVLDLCAAPGGKSTLLQSLLNNESLLVSNDVIKQRAAILEENITKWGAANVVVTNNDPGHFARLENYFDVMVIDAPCSGSGLFRRDPEAVSEWSDSAVALCSQRQQRIIADAWPALKQDGILIYATCSYSEAEDEGIADWIADNFTVTGRQLTLASPWNITETRSKKHGLAGYRFYPDKIKGEGFFITVLKKNDGGTFHLLKPAKTKLEKISKSTESIVYPWLKDPASLVLFKQQDDIIAFPAALENDLSILQSALYIKKAGVTVGRLAGKDLIPAHALAVSNLLDDDVARFSLTNQQAIQYLRREEFSLPVAALGWVLVTYQEHPLGWIKVLPNRFNNYYPKEWRILKQPLKT